MKQKTNKAASKRFAVTSNGKVKRRATGQGHFNARANGDETRRKHQTELVDKSDHGHLDRLLPNR